MKITHIPKDKRIEIRYEEDEKDMLVKAMKIIAISYEIEVEELSEKEKIKNAILGDAMEELGEHLTDMGDGVGLKLLKNIGTEIRKAIKRAKKKQYAQILTVGKRLVTT